MESYSSLLQDILRILNEARDDASPEKAAECSRSALHVERRELESLLSNPPTISETGWIKVRSAWSNDLLGESYEMQRRKITSRILFAERSPLLSTVGSNDGSGSSFLLCSLPASEAEKANTDESRNGPEESRDWKHSGPVEQPSVRDNHLAMLVRAWSVVLSNSWARWIGDGNREAPTSKLCQVESASSVEACIRLGSNGYVNLEYASEVETSWWVETLSVDGPSYYVVKGDKKLYSPWNRRFECLESLSVLTHDNYNYDREKRQTSKFDGRKAIERYVCRFNLEKQSWIAFGIATWLPSMRSCTDLSLPTPIHRADAVVATPFSSQDCVGVLVQDRDLRKMVLEALIWRKLILKCLLHEIGGGLSVPGAAGMTVVKAYWPYAAREERRLYESWESLRAFPLAPLGFTGGRGWLRLAFMDKYSLTAAVHSASASSMMFVASLWKTPWNVLHTGLVGWKASVENLTCDGVEAPCISQQDYLLHLLFNSTAVDNYSLDRKACYVCTRETPLCSAPLSDAQELSLWASKSRELRLRLCDLTWAGTSSVEMGIRTEEKHCKTPNALLTEAELTEANGIEWTQLRRGIAPEDGGCGSLLQQQSEWWENAARQRRQGLESNSQMRLWVEPVVSKIEEALSRNLKIAEVGKVDGVKNNADLPQAEGEAAIRKRGPVL